MLALAVPTGFEPATSGLTGRRALQTAPRDLMAAPPYRAATSPSGGFPTPVTPPRRHGAATDRAGLGPIGSNGGVPPTGFEPVPPP